MNKRMNLYKAVKFQVMNFTAECGMNLVELWKMVNTDTEQGYYWKVTCLADYDTCTM